MKLDPLVLDYGLEYPEKDLNSVPDKWNIDPEVLYPGLEYPEQDLNSVPDKWN